MEAKMNANRIAKTEQVKEIIEKIKNSKSVVVANYAGLNVKSTQQLRNLFREKNVEFKVYKNRLVKIAAKELGLEDLIPSLTGPNAFAFGIEDDISPAKIIATFAKDNPALEIKAGTFEGKVLDQAGMMEVATLPTYEEALTKLAMGFMTPLRELGVGLKMLADEGHLTAE